MGSIASPKARLATAQREGPVGCVRRLRGNEEVLVPLDGCPRERGIASNGGEKPIEAPFAGGEGRLPARGERAEKIGREGTDDRPVAKVLARLHRRGAGLPERRIRA